MAAMARRIDTVEARAKLPAQRAPYWLRLQTGCTLGYRKITPASVGTWVAKVRDAHTGKTTWQSLGAFEELPAGGRYRAAKDAAEALAKHVDAGGSPDVVTVADACRYYVKHLRGAGKHANAADAEARFGRWLYDSALARVQLRRLGEHQVSDWRKSLTATAVVVNPHAPAGARTTRARAPSSINRDMVPLRAALNLAHKRKAVTSDAAWLEALEPIVNADRQRGGYLDRAQRAALIAASPPDLAQLVRALASIPMRPGAMAALTAGDFDRRLSTLRIAKDKAGAGRTITLPPATAEFFAELTRDKLPAAPLLTRADGRPWDKDSWKKPLKTAAAAAGLPAGTVLYSLRHAVVTDLVSAGLDLATVATLAGTSVEMIRKHYHHLQPGRARDALATLAL